MRVEFSEELIIHLWSHFTFHSVYHWFKTARLVNLENGREIVKNYLLKILFILPQNPHVILQTQDFVFSLTLACRCKKKLGVMIALLKP